MKIRVILWTCPRSVSTAFERSIRTLENGKVFHEPFSFPFFYGPERQSPRFLSEEIDPKATYQSVCEMLQREYEGKKFVFSKDVALCVENKFHIFLEEGFQNFKHTFLIRHPLKVVYSQFKICANETVGGFENFDPAEAGFRELLELYEFVERHIHKNPVVVDADDLLDFPKEIMQSYCEAVGLQFEDHMTSWQPGPVPEWEKCLDWHNDVITSSGFVPRSPEKTKVFSVDDLPADAAAVVKESMPYYEALRAKRIRPKTQGF